MCALFLKRCFFCTSHKSLIRVNPLIGTSLKILNCSSLLTVILGRMLIPSPASTALLSTAYCQAPSHFRFVPKYRSQLMRSQQSILFLNPFLSKAFFFCKFVNVNWFSFLPTMVVRCNENQLINCKFFRLYSDWLTRPSMSAISISFASSFDNIYGVFPINKLNLISACFVESFPIGQEANIHL